MTLKAQIGDYIRTKGMPRPLKVIAADDYSGYQLETGAVLSDAEISINDVLLESEVIHEFL